MEDAAHRKLQAVSQQRAALKAPVPGEAKEDIDEKAHVARLRQTADICDPASALCQLEKQTYEAAERRLWAHQLMAKLKGAADKMKLDARAAAKEAATIRSDVNALQKEEQALKQKMKSSAAEADDTVKLSEVQQQLTDKQQIMWDSLKASAELNSKLQAAEDAVSNAHEIAGVTSKAAQPLQEKLFKLYAEGKTKDKKEIESLAAQIKQLERMGDDVYRSVEARKAAATLQAELDKLPAQTAELAAQVEAFHKKADGTVDQEYRATLMESAQSVQDQITALKSKTTMAKKLQEVQTRSNAAAADVSRYTQMVKESQDEVDSMQESMNAKVIAIQTKLNKSLRIPTQEGWERMQASADALHAMELIDKKETARKAKLTEVVALVKPMLEEIRELHEKATDTAQPANRAKFNGQADLLWDQIDRTRKEMMEQVTVEAEMLETFKADQASMSTQASIIGSDVKFLAKNVEELKSVIAAETAEAGDNKEKAAQLTKELKIELIQAEGELRKKEDDQWYADAKLAWTSKTRVEDFEGAHDQRVEQRKIEEEKLLSSLKRVQEKMIDGMHLLWKKTEVGEVEVQGEAVIEILRRAQEILAPWSLGKSTDRDEGHHSETPPAPPMSPPPRKSPLEWEQKIHDQRMADMMHVNDHLEVELKKATWVAAHHGGPHMDESATDAIEDQNDAEVVGTIGNETDPGYQMNCKKFPLLCTVNKAVAPDQEPEVPPIPPPAPDPLEVAQKLVNDQSAIVTQLQEELASIQMAPSPDEEAEGLKKAELEEQSKLMVQAQKHLKHLQGNAEELAARKAMKTAQAKVDALTKNLDMLEKEDPPVQSLVEKSTVRLSTAEERLNEMRDKYKAVLALSGSKIGEKIITTEDTIDIAKKDLEKEIESEVQKPEVIDALKKKILTLSATLLEQKTERERLAAASEAAGAAPGPPGMYYWPTEEEKVSLEKVQTEKMLSAINNVTKLQMSEPVYGPQAEAYREMQLDSGEQPNLAEAQDVTNEDVPALGTDESTKGVVVEGERDVTQLRFVPTPEMKEQWQQMADKMRGAFKTMMKFAKNKAGWSHVEGSTKSLS
jgi:hypothetical protein